MKALSIRQPWAWLIIRPDLTGQERADAIRLHFVKHLENRSWFTDYTGPLLVHASKGMTMEEYNIAQMLAESLGIQLPKLDEIDRGGIVGVVDMVGCTNNGNRSPWFFGPYAFIFENPRPIPFVPFRGALSFFEVPADVLPPGFVP